MADRVRVLHVTGDPSTSALSAALDGTGRANTTTTAASVADASEHLASNPVDCVVSDHDPDGVDGVACLDAARDAGYDGPFVAIADGEGDATETVLSAGATDCVQATAPPAVVANRVVRAVDAARTQSRLDTCERRLAELTERATDVLWMFTADWDELLFVNRAYEEVWGRPRAALREEPRDFLAGVHPDDRETVEAAMDALSDGESVDVEYRVNADEGYGRWVWVQGEPVVDDGEVVRVVGFARDVTDRHNREDDLQRQNERLENVARVLSHDLRNPLNVALSRVQLAREDGTEGGEDHLAATESALERIDRMVDDVLALTRSGHAVDRTPGVDVSSLARGCWRNVATGDAGLQVADGIRLDVDPSGVERVFENLFRNAVEHGTGDDGTDVTVRVGPLDDGSGVYVADDGVGIPVADRECVFDTGYTTGDDETGFGLTIVQEAVAAHGGSVTVTASADGGARFEVDLGATGAPSGRGGDRDTGTDGGVRDARDTGVGPRDVADEKWDWIGEE